MQLIVYLFIIFDALQTTAGAVDRLWHDVSVMNVLWLNGAR